jgi:hypothetical protein
MASVASTSPPASEDDSDFGPEVVTSSVSSRGRRIYVASRHRVRFDEQQAKTVVALLIELGREKIKEAEKKKQGEPPKPPAP